MRKYLLSLIIVVCFIPYAAAQQQASIEFTIKNVGINVDGHFNDFIITSVFDDTNILERITGEIKVKSIETGIDSRDEHLLKEDYFNISNFPTITLKTITLEKIATNQYSAKVNLTIKGKTKQITIPITVETFESLRKVTSKFEINRRDFGVGGRSLVMSNSVKISVVHIENINGQN